jgi:hypothetical protein
LRLKSGAAAPIASVLCSSAGPGAAAREKRGPADRDATNNRQMIFEGCIGLNFMKSYNFTGTRSFLKCPDKRFDVVLMW